MVFMMSLTSRPLESIEGWSVSTLANVLLYDFIWGILWTLGCWTVINEILRGKDLDLASADIVSSLANWVACHCIHLRNMSHSCKWSEGIFALEDVFVSSTICWISLASSLISLSPPTTSLFVPLTYPYPNYPHPNLTNLIIPTRNPTRHAYIYLVSLESFLILIGNLECSALLLKVNKEYLWIC